MKISKNLFRLGLITLSALLFSLPTLAQDASAPIAAEKLSVWTSGAGVLMLAIIVVLMAVIYILGSIVKTLVEEDTLDMARSMKLKKGILTVLFFWSGSLVANAQNASATVNGVPMILDLEATVFWLLFGILLFEFMVILVLCFILYTFLLRKGLIRAFHISLPKWLQWNTIMGSDKPIEQEAEQLIGHDYDGIQELDNGMPPMLKYIFIGSIFFAVYYMVDYHVLNASPLSIAEYEAQLEKGKQDRLDYIKKAGELVDENTVSLLTDPSMIAGGEKLYALNCVACHGNNGQGGVGPNLTDAYWLHGGDIQSIFKSIKYGIPEKGMRSWQSEIKPADLQILVSYIIATFGNKNVANGKAPQGDLYQATTITSKDTTSTILANTTVLSSNP